VSEENNKPSSSSFIPEKTGDTNKYRTFTGVRENTPVVDTETLRKEMREKVGATAESSATDLGAALSNANSKAIRYGIVGVGHGGSRLAEQFYQFGYKVCVANTAQQDLHHINLPANQKLFMDYALGGAGKDMDIGAAAATECEPQIKTLLELTFGPDAQSVDAFILCVGGGGGTGTGSAVPMIATLSDYNLPVTVLYTLPTASEGTITKSNAIEGLNKLAQLSVNKLINGLIIIDNSKIEELYPNVSLGGLYKVANFDIANIFNTFNTLSSLPTQYSAIDPMDFAKIVTSGNCTIYGKVEIPLIVENGQVASTEDDIADILLQQLQHGLLAEGFNVTEALRFGVYVTGKSQYLDQIPASTFNFAFASLNQELKSADMFKGVYGDERLGDSLVIYLLVSGVGLPRERIDTLMAQSQQDVEEMEEKEQNTRAKMEVFQQASNRELDKYKVKKKENSTFGKMVNRRKGRS